jgi:hypothetical protein
MKAGYKIQEQFILGAPKEECSIYELGSFVWIYIKE